MAVNIERRDLSAAELRKVRKPLIERKRRERINESLEQMKTLLLREMNKDESQFAKIEKADILELAVEYLSARPLHAARTSHPHPAQAVQRYTEGFTHCMHEVHKCLSSSPETAKPEVHHRVMHHLGAHLMTVPQKAASGIIKPTGLDGYHQQQQYHIQQQQQQQYQTQHQQRLSADPTHQNMDHAKQRVPGSHSAPPPPSGPIRVPALYPLVDLNNNTIHDNENNINNRATSSRTGSGLSGSLSPESMSSSRNSTPSFMPSQVPERFFNPITVQIDGEEKAPHAVCETSPAARKLDFFSENVMRVIEKGDEGVMSAKQSWLKRVHEERMKEVSEEGEMWRPW